VRETYGFIAKMAIAGADDIAVWAFSPYPGSELFQQINASGRLKLDDAYYDSLRSYADTTRTVSYSENFTDAQLKKLRWIGVAIFYLTSWLVRPVRPFKIVWHVFTGKHETRSEMALANILRRFKMGAGT
jgi:anaerobic magnesium-protoporphyrin IX monomethyl ester cyclase